MSIETFVNAAKAIHLPIIDHGDEGVFIGAEQGDDRIVSGEFWIAPEVEQLAEAHGVWLEWENPALVGLSNI